MQMHAGPVSSYELYSVDLEVLVLSVSSVTFFKQFRESYVYPK